MESKNGRFLDKSREGSVREVIAEGEEVVARRWTPKALLKDKVLEDDNLGLVGFAGKSSVQGGANKGDAGPKRAP